MEDLTQFWEPLSSVWPEARSRATGDRSRDVVRGQVTICPGANRGVGCIRLEVMERPKEPCIGGQDQLYFLRKMLVQPCGRCMERSGQEPGKPERARLQEGRSSGEKETVPGIFGGRKDRT